MAWCSWAPACAGATIAAALLSQGAAAQTYPSRPVAWVVPFAPGGITDHTSRMIARHLTADLGQQVVIENRPGAGGSLGTEQVARAAPDGQTLIYGTQGTMAANTFLYKALRYHPLRDFAPVHAMFASPNVIVANPARAFRTLGELVEFARANPGVLTMASAGAGTGTHLSGELMQAVAGIRMTHVPYKGSAPALTDLIGGQVDVMFDYAISAGAHVQAGKLRGLAVTGATRLAMLPSVPTSAEAGVPGIESSSWSGLFAPVKTPADTLARLTRAMETAMAAADVVRYAEQYGSRVLAGLTGAKFAQFVEFETARWGDVIRRADVRLD